MQIPILKAGALAVLIALDSSSLAEAQQVSAPKTAADISVTPAGTIMTPQYIEAVGQLAYIWGWPLVNNFNRAAAVANLPEPGLVGGVLPASPPGYVSMLTDYISEKQRFVTCPNQDTVYGAGYQHLDSKPVIVQVPDFGDRFFTYQIVDARTDSLCSIGKQHGTKPGFYLLVGPNWKGEPPSGVNAVYRSPTDLCAIFPRVFQDDTPEDKAAIQPLLSQVMVYPLSEFDGTMKTKDWKATPKFPAPTSGAGETKWVIPEKFFDQLPQILKEIPPLPGEESLYAMIQSVLEAAEKDPKVKETLTQTAIAAEKDLISPLFEFHNNGRPVGNGWTSPPNGARWGVDYLSRAATAKSNMYDNAPEETRYIYTDFDSLGQRLNGANAYTVTFKNGETPPVNGFWSLTLYNAEHLFSPNPLNRYSLGTKSKSLKLGADGSLTLYVQSESPGADKESNWLPAPRNGDFSLYIRAYWPQAAILDGTWTPPKIEKEKSTAQTSRFNEVAELPFVENRPTKVTAKTLRDELLFQRAVQTYLWALPLINTLGMKVGSEKAFGAGYNVLPIWKRRLDAKTLVTTPNSDVIYAMSYVDLGKDGPLVFEAPPQLQGILLDFWQRPIPVDGGKFFGDVGLPGPDGGKGGKFLLLPPGYKGAVPEGYFVYRSATNNVFVFLRSFYQDPKNLTPAVALVEQSKIYPLNGKATAKPMTFPDASGVPANMLPISDGSAFDQLKLLVDSEGTNLADSDWLGVLASIGIIEGQPFNPDPHTREILDRAAKTAYKMSRVIGFETLVSGRSFRVYADRQWVNPIADGTPENPGGVLDLAWKRKDGGYLDLDCRIWFFTDYYSISPGMISQVPGKGAKYMIAFTDSQGTPLTGSTAYRINLPTNIPAANFWSVTLYEAENASGLANGQPFPSLGSRDKPAQNADGSTDLYLGPRAPDAKEGNWLATVPGKGYFAILRLYGPTEAAINKSWKPGDIEQEK